MDQKFYLDFISLQVKRWGIVVDVDDLDMESGKSAARRETRVPGLDPHPALLHRLEVQLRDEDHEACDRLHQHRALLLVLLQRVRDGPILKLGMFTFFIPLAAGIVS